MRIGGYWGVLTSAGLLLSACAGSGHKLPPPSTDIDETVFRDHVRVLASDDFEGRKPGTPGEEKTVAYLVEQFRKLGLKPGNGVRYLQQVPVVESLAGADASLSDSRPRSEEHTSELQSHSDLVCRLLLEKKKNRPDG